VTNTPPPPPWPFPPPGGPVPWTAEQVRDYQRQQRENAPTAPW